MTASRSVFLPTTWSPILPSPSRSWPMSASSSRWWGVRSSRHIFQLHPEQQDAAGREEAEYLQQAGWRRGRSRMRSAVAARMPTRIALPRWSLWAGLLPRGQHDDGVVARQHEVDHDDREEGCQRFRRSG